MRPDSKHDGGATMGDSSIVGTSTPSRPKPGKPRSRSQSQRRRTRSAGVASSLNGGTHDQRRQRDVSSSPASVASDASAASPDGATATPRSRSRSRRRRSARSKSKGATTAGDSRGGAEAGCGASAAGVGVPKLPRTGSGRRSASSRRRRSRNRTRTRSSRPEDFALGVAVHRSDALHPQRNLEYLAVRTHLVHAGNGHLFHSETAVADAAAPAGALPTTTTTTVPFDVKAKKTLAPAWEELSVFHGFMHDTVTHTEQQGMLLFEIVDVPLSTDSGPSSWVGQHAHGPQHKHQQHHKYEDACIPVAWAFLKLRNARSELNTERKVRLQLYKPPSSTVQRAVQARSRLHRGMALPGGAAAHAPTQPAIAKWFVSGKKRSQYPGSLYVTAKRVRVGGTGGVGGVGPQGTGARPAAGGAGSNATAAAGRHTVSFVPSDPVLAHGSSAEQAMVMAAHKPEWSRRPGQLARVPNELQHRLWAGEGGCFSLSFSSDGTRLAVACRAATDRFPIIVYHVYPSSVDAPFFLEGQLSGHRNMCYDLSWSSDDKLLVSASSDGTCCVWDGDSLSPAPLKSLPHPCFVYAAKLRPQPYRETASAKVLITGAYDGKVRVWDISTPGPHSVPIKEFQAHVGNINALTLDNSGIKMFTADGAGVVKIWTASPGQHTWSLLRCIADPDIKNDAINTVVLHPLGRRLLVCARDNLLRMMDLRTYSFFQTFPGAVNEHACVRGDISPCGTYVASGSEDGSLHVWECDSGAEVLRLGSLGFSGPINTVAFHPHDDIMAVAAFGSGNPVLILRHKAAAAPTDAGDSHPAAGNTLSATAGNVSTLTSLSTMEETWTTAPSTSTDRFGTFTDRSELMHLQRTKERSVAKVLNETQQAIDARRQVLSGSTSTPTTRRDPDHRGLAAPLFLGDSLKQPLQAYIAGEMSDSSLDGDTTTSMRMRSPAPAARCVAVYDFERRKPDELSFQTGDIFAVESKGADGWWRVTRAADKATGLIPGNYVEMQAPTSVTLSSATSTRMQRQGLRTEALRKARYAKHQAS